MTSLERAFVQAKKLPLEGTFDKTQYSGLTNFTKEAVGTWLRAMSQPVAANDRIIDALGDYAANLVKASFRIVKKENPDKAVWLRNNVDDPAVQVDISTVVQEGQAALSVLFEKLDIDWSTDEKLVLDYIKGIPIKAGIQAGPIIAQRLDNLIAIFASTIKTKRALKIQPVLLGLDSEKVHEKFETISDIFGNEISARAAITLLPTLLCYNSASLRAKAATLTAELGNQDNFQTVIHNLPTIFSIKPETIHLKFQYLDSIFGDRTSVIKAVSTNPRLLTYSTERLTTTMDYFVTTFDSAAKVRRAIKLQPSLLSYDVNSIRRKIFNLEEIFANPILCQQAIISNPKLLSYNEGSVREKLSVLADIFGDVAIARAAVSSLPTLLSLNSETIGIKFNYFIECFGDVGTARTALCCTPELFAYGQVGLDAKVANLVDIFGNMTAVRSALCELPSLLCYNPETVRLKARQMRQRTDTAGLDFKQFIVRYPELFWLPLDTLDGATQRLLKGHTNTINYIKMRTRLIPLAVDGHDAVAQAETIEDAVIERIDQQRLWTKIRDKFGDDVAIKLHQFIDGDCELDNEVATIMQRIRSDAELLAILSELRTA